MFLPRQVMHLKVAFTGMQWLKLGVKPPKCCLGLDHYRCTLVHSILSKDHSEWNAFFWKAFYDWVMVSDKMCISSSAPLLDMSTFLCSLAWLPQLPGRAVHFETFEEYLLDLTHQMVHEIQLVNLFPVISPHFHLSSRGFHRQHRPKAG